jgi:hypothetical protein
MKVEGSFETAREEGGGIESWDTGVVVVLPRTSLLRSIETDKGGGGRGREWGRKGADRERRKWRKKGIVEMMGETDKHHHHHHLHPARARTRASILSARVNFALVWWHVWNSCVTASWRDESRRERTMGHERCVVW